MFVAHAPVGLLTASALRAPLERRVGPLRGLTAVAVAGALAPDADLVLWLADPSVHHHAWPTHWPIAWASLCGAVLPGLLHPRTRATATLALVFAGNGLLHQVLDTLVGDVRWLAPFSPRAWSLFTVARVHEPWWLNFLLHPTFAVEVALGVLALVVTTRRTAATPSPPGARPARRGAPTDR